MTFDEIRARHPHFGFALYAYEPQGPVTFEVHTPEGDVFTSEQFPTSREAMASLFPSPTPPEEPDDEPQAAPQEESVFD